MNISTILTIIGILATVLFGIWGVYVIIRRRYPGKITLVVDNCIGLFDTIVKNFPELVVLYQEEPISHGLVLFKGTFLNSGKKDITPEMVEDKIALNLPEDFKWLAAKTVGSSPNVHISIVEEPNSLRFSTRLFRCQEYFKFEALAEVPIPKKDNSISAKLVNNINPSHRIADTGKIQEVYLPQESNTKWSFLKRIRMPSLILFLGLFLFVFVFLRGMPLQIHFQIPQKDGSVAEVTVEPCQDGTIHITSKAHDIDEKVNAERFFSRSDIRAKIVNIVPYYLKVLIICFCFVLYFILPVVMIYLDIREQRKLRHLRKQIGLD